MKSKSKGDKHLLLTVALVLHLILCNTLMAADANVAEVPVLVNYVDHNGVGSVPQGTKDQVEEAIKKANEILGKFGISLEHTDSNAVQTPSGDGDANMSDRSSMRASGAHELDTRYGDCNGLKINIVNDIVEGTPGKTWRGVAVSGSKVIIIDVNQMDVNDPNGFGRTIAHETTHDIGDMRDTYDANDVNKLNYGYAGGGTELDPNDANDFRRRARERGRTVAVHSIAPGGVTGIVTSQSGYIADARGVISDDLDDAFSPAPGFDPTDRQFKYADIRYVKLFCGEPGQLNSTTHVTVYLDGPFPDYDFTGSYSVWIVQGPGPDPTGKIEIDISQAGPDIFVAAYYTALPGGLPFELGPTTVKNNAEMVEDPDINVPVTAAIEIDDVPTEMISMNLASEESTRMYATAEVADPMLGNMIYDETDTFDFGLSLRETDPVIYLINPGQGADGLTYGVAGAGFTGIPEVEIKIDDEPIGNAAVRPDGTFRFFTNDPAFEFTPGAHKIVVNPTPGMVPAGHGIWAVLRLDFPKLKSDLNEDGVVNMYDFAVFASDWLK